MNLVSTLRDSLVSGILADGELALALADCARVSIEVAPANVDGDLATNAALILAQRAKRAPLELARQLEPILQASPYVDSCAVVKPGFINIHLSAHAHAEVLRAVLEQKHDYGEQHLALRESRQESLQESSQWSRQGSAQGSTQESLQEKPLINIEFVSANPTGPLHIGHTRGAVIGDVLANLLTKCGYRVLREYYVNDRGEQMRLLARSLHWRYSELFAGVVKAKEHPHPHPHTMPTMPTMPAVPDGLYPGAYLIECAEALRERDGDKWLEEGEARRVSSPVSSLDSSSLDSSPFWLQPLLEFAREYMMERISSDLLALGVDFRGNFVSEQALVEAGKIEKLLADLQRSGAAQLGRLPPPKAKRGQLAAALQDGSDEDRLSREHLLLETKRFGDSENRVLRTADGKITYFASDIAYHVDKLVRGASHLIDIFGADHSGHAQRLRAALKACNYGSDSSPALEVVSCQIVRLLEGGKPLKMSKRGGSFLDLRSLLTRVGRDAVRFLMLTRKSDAPLDFDLDAAVAKSHDNPVFYVQYAHARCCSVLRMAQKTWLEVDDGVGEKLDENFFTGADFGKLTQKTERLLIRDIALFPRTLESAARSLEPHRVVFALISLAAVLHSWWNEGNKARSLRIIYPDDKATMRARLALVRAAQIVLAIGLRLCGVDAPEEMA